MSRITRVNIRNYRGIRELRLKPNRINIFVGRNNTGKSSALEAITLAISFLNDFRDLLDRNIVTEIIERRMRHSIKYFVNIDDNKSDISLEIDSSSKLKLVLDFFDDGRYPKSEVGTDFLSFLDKRSIELIERSFFFELEHALLKREKSMEVLSDLFRKRFEDEKNKFISNILNTPKLFFVGYLNNRILSEAIYLQPDYGKRRSQYFFDIGGFSVIKAGRSTINVPLLYGMSGRAFDIYELYDAAVRKNKISKVLDTLRINIEYFDDLRKIEEEMVCTFQNLKEPIPLPFMGDGFVTLTKIIFVSLLAETGVVVLEEPENNLHPGYLRIVAEQMIENKDTQFFLSTHNVELMEYLIENEKKLDEIQFIRMYLYSDGELGYELLSGHEAKYELDELKADLRGT